MHRSRKSGSCVAFLAALVLVACGDDGAGPIDPGGGLLLTGSVHAVGGGDVEGIWAIWRVEGSRVADSSRVEADGTFSIRASTGGASTQTGSVRGELLIDGPEPRNFHPFLFPFRAEEINGLRLLLIPRRWTIRAGIYEGETVATPLDPVVEDNANQMRYTYFFGQPHPFNAPERYLLDLMTWPTENLPARVAIDHNASTSEVTPSDSAAMWAVFERMEAVVGLNLFEATEAEPGWWAGSDSSRGQPVEPGVIRLIHDPPSWRARLQSDEDARVFDRDLGTWAATGRFKAFRESHTHLSAGGILVGAFEPLRLADGFIPWETVLTHEMVHVLGLGHTCRIPSPMGPCMRTTSLSRSDAAYMELLRETLRLARELVIPYALMPSIIGERKVLLGAPALPELEG